MTMITPSYLGETIEYSSLHACRSTLEDPTHNIALRRGASGTLTEEQLAWRLKEAAVSFSSPLAYEGRVYLVNRAGVAFCCDENSGKSLWTERLGGSCWASPIGGAGRVYFFDKDGVTTVVAAKAELEKLAENRLTIEGRVYGVAAVEGAFVLRTGKKLFCVGKPLKSVTGG